jgi:hypothetical protein
MPIFTIGNTSYFSIIILYTLELTPSQHPMDYKGGGEEVRVSPQ